jgi:hypothetical protein
MSPNAFTFTWVNDRAGAPVMKWTVDQAPIQHRAMLRTPGISEGRHRD